MTLVRISDDALALACGADAVAAAFAAAGCTVERVSTWGLHWLEPLVEIDGIGWGPVTVDDVAKIVLVSAEPEWGGGPPAQPVVEGAPHSGAFGAAPSTTPPAASRSPFPSLRDREELCIGRIADHPFLACQQRLTFARAGRTRPLSLDDYAATGGWAGLARAGSLAPQEVIAEITAFGLRGRGGAGFPADQMADRRRGAIRPHPPPQIHRLQCRRGR